MRHQPIRNGRQYWTSTRINDINYHLIIYKTVLIILLFLLDDRMIGWYVYWWLMIDDWW
jgi:hypothetical protein